MSQTEIMHSEAGLALLRHALASGGMGPGIGRTLGIRGVQADPGKVVLEGVPTEDHQNPAGTAHGGYIATLLDGAMALALQTCLEPGTGYATTDLNIQFMKPVKLNAGRVLAEAEVVSLGKSRALAKVRLVNQDGDARALATGSFAIAR